MTSADTNATASPAVGRDAAQLVRGVSPVLEVPFTADGEVDTDAFAHVVDHVLGTGVSSVMFPGFASEFHKLSDPEREVLLDILLARTAPRDDVAAIVAVQDHATHLAVRRAHHAVTAGADLINLLPPHFLAPPRGAVVAHAEAVLAAIAPTPVVLQYAPSETGTSLDAATLRALANAHPNLAMVKVESNPPGRLIADLSAGHPPLAALEGYAGVQLPDAHNRGAIGTQPGCSFTEIYQAIWQHLSDGDTDAGTDLHRRLLPYISYWMLDPELIIAAEKLISTRRGLIPNPTCRDPAHQLDAEEVATIDRFCDQFADLLPRRQP